jgi:hypothetical protein
MARLAKLASQGIDKNLAKQARKFGRSSSHKKEGWLIGRMVGLRLIVA